MKTKNDPLDVYPIRVLHIVNSMGFGGIQSFLINLYRNINQEQVQFDFMIHVPCNDGFEDEIRSLGGRIYYQQPPRIRNIVGYISDVKQFLKEHQEYRIVHIHLRTVAAIWSREAKCKGQITVVHSHSTTNGYGFNGAIKNVIQFPIRWTADYFMGCSVAANEWMFGKKIAHSNRCTVLNNGIEIENFRFNPEKRRHIRASLGIDDNVTVLGNVGRLVEQKNQLFLLPIIKNLIEEYPKDQYRLVIVGEGPLQERLLVEVHNLGLEDYVMMLGRRSDVKELLSAFDLFLLPSRDEGLGIVAIEAQASGLPVLCSDAIPAEAQVTELCTLLPLDNMDCWCEKIVSIDNNLLESGYNRAAFNRKVGEAGFDIKEVSNRLLIYYLELLK